MAALESVLESVTSLDERKEEKGEGTLGTLGDQEGGDR